MSSIVIDLPGPPRGKGRPRFRIVNPKAGKQFGSVYTDAKTAGYEGALRQIAALKMRGIPLMEGPLRVVITATFLPATSWPKRKKSDALSGVIRPTGKPDFDNLAKVIDALNGIVWPDDSQVVDGRVIKQYGDKPSLRIECWNVNPAAPGL
jgi:Holliday junction resolvase RusA-like endonuclease